MKKTWTIDGQKDIMPNGLAQKGEQLWEINDDSVKAQFIDTGKEGIDDQPIKTSQNTYIPSNKLGFDKILEPYAKRVQDINKAQQAADKNKQFSSLYKQTSKLQNEQLKRLYEDKVEPIVQLQSTLQQNSGLKKYDDGTVPVTEIPFLQRILPTLVGTGAGLTKLLHWTSEPVKYHDTYKASPYSNLALNELSKLRANPYNGIQAARDMERVGSYALTNSGLTGGQKFLGRIAQNIGLQKNIADIYNEADKQNNVYKQEYAKALLTEGNQIASMRQNAAQHDYANYVAAHGRKTHGIESAIADLVNQVNSAYANEFKYRTWQDTANLYRQQLTDEQKARLEELKFRKSIANTSTPQSTYRYVPQFTMSEFIRSPRLSYGNNDFWTNPKLFS